MLTPISGAYGDPLTPQFTPASLHDADAKSRTYDLGRNSDSSAYALLFLVSCLKSLSAGDFDKAIAACTETVLIDPQNSAGFKLRGMAYFGKGRLSEGLADFDQAIALDPNDAESHAAQGAVFRAQGETARAVDAYSYAIALQPTDSRWWNARCWTRATARTELMVALADCNKALALNSKSAMAYDSRGLTNLQLGRYRAAVRDYSSALALNRLASSYFGRGIAKLKLADNSGDGDIARARTIDHNIDAVFRGYGIIAPKPSPRMPMRSASLAH